MITEIQSFLQVFSLRKAFTQLFWYFRKSEKIHKKLYCWHILDLYNQITHNSCGYLHSLFLPDCNVFFVCLVPFIYICLYFLILRSYFHLLFLTHFATRRILQFTLFDSISLRTTRNITEIKKHFMVHDVRKSIALIITKTKIWAFPSILSNYFLFSFWSG